MCATCHIYVPEDLAERLPSPVNPEEVETLEDNLLDPYFDPLRSRLGCQLKVKDLYEDCVIEVPQAALNSDSSSTLDTHKFPVEQFRVLVQEIEGAKGKGAADLNFGLSSNDDDEISNEEIKYLIASPF